VELVENSAMKTDLAAIALEVRDRLEIADAVYRYTAGMDLNNLELIASAFTADAVADFTPAARKLKQDFPVLQGRDTIVQAMLGTVCKLDTTHSVTNPRIELRGDTAKLYALSEAQHLPPQDHSRHFLMKSWYDVDLVRDGEGWRIRRITIDAVWHTGDPGIILGR
jgi:hypothetical protein